MAAEQAASTSAKESDPIRPALIVDAQTLMGQHAFLQHLFVGFAAESCKAALVCPPEFDTSLMPAGPVEIITHPAFRTVLLWPENLRKLLVALEKFKPTILHCLSWKKTNLTKRLAEMLDLPYVMTLNALPKHTTRYRISSRRCSAIIAPARSVATDVEKNYPSLAARVKRINMGTFVEDTCACFSRPGQTASMVVMHQLRHAEELKPLLNSLRHLVIDGYELAVVIIGTARAEGQVRRLLRDMGLSQIVNIVGGVQQLRPVFKGADIFIQPRPVQVFNGNLIEAMSVGMAVAGCLGGVDDLLVEDQTAVIFDPDDELSIYAALQKLLDKREFARQIALAGQLQIRRDYSVSKMVSAFLKTYRNAGQQFRR